MISGYNGQYWFHVEHQNPAFSLGGNPQAHVNQATKQMTSFSVTEEEYAAGMADFTIRDNTGLFSKAFRRGQQLTLRWGLDIDPLSLLTYFADLESDEITGASFMRSMTGTVMSANGFFQGGEHFLRVVIRMGFLQQRAKLSVTFTEGTVGSILSQIASQYLDVPVANQVISFSESTTVVSKRQPLIMAGETVLEFLRRMAVKYNAKLIFQHKPLPPGVSGSSLLMQFVGFDQEDNVSHQGLALRSVSGSYHYMDYGNDKSNIVDDPEYDLGDGSSMGSVPIVSQVDGRYQLTFVSAETEYTTQYTLNSAKIKSDLASRPTGERFELLKLIEEGSFESFAQDGQILPPYNRYFIRETFRTAPEQLGWQFNCHVIPNPLMQVGDRAWIGPKTDNGQSVIPPHLKSYRAGGSPRTWRVAKMIWSHDGSKTSHKVTLKK